RGGASWAFHLDRLQTDVLLKERAWSHVVLQDYSTRPTAVGDAEGLRRDGERLYKRARALVPGPKVVHDQTWTRAAGHELYQQEGVQDPDDMERQLLLGYAALEQQLEELEEGDQVLRAPVGTVFARHLRQHPASKIHGQDLYHASTEGSYLAALVL